MTPKSWAFSTGEWSLLVHGGAGELEASARASHVAGCEAACALAAETLRCGGSALDAVELAVRGLEADPLFNAGTGASLNEDGALELDAAIMLSDARAGAIAALPPFEHPISVARKLLELEEHVLLVGEGAARFAVEFGFEPSTPERMITDGARKRLAIAKERGDRTSQKRVDSGNTVGAVAKDMRGNFAAATSTGGKTNKRKGRVGDTPILGAGTYASGRGAASATGDGEAFMRMLAGRIAVEDARAPLDAHLASVLDELRRRFHGTGGLILVTPDHGSIARSTSSMPWALMSALETRSGS